MNEKTVNANITKYKALKVLAYLSVAAVGIIALIINTPIASCIAVMFIIAWSNFVPKKFIPSIFEKYIKSSLVYALDALDAPLYMQILKKSGTNTPDATYRLCGEYHSGNYQAAADICTQCLADEKLASFKYSYYEYLALCYFDIGNDKKLKEVCDAFMESVEKEAPKVKEYLLKNCPNITFFTQYLSGEYEKCLDRTNRESDSKRTSLTRKFRKAVILLQTGEKAEAKALFESVQNGAPSFHLAWLASHGIEAIEKGIPYRETFENITPSNEELPELKRIKRNAKLGKILTVVAICCFAAIFIFSIFNYAGSLGNSETSKLIEEIRVLAEENYDGVEVVDAFNLKKDGEIIDTMFICKTDEKYIIGSVFSYVGEDVKHIFVGAEFDVVFDTSDTITMQVPSIDKDYLAEVIFCENQEDVPKENQHSSVIDVNGKDVYFAVTGTVENPLSFLYDVFQSLNTVS